MSEHSSFEIDTTPEQAYGTFKRLVGIAMSETLGTAWSVRGGLFDGKPKYLERRREVAHLREIPAMFRSTIVPKHNEPGWSGPTYLIDEGEGVIERQLKIYQCQTAEYARGWRRNGQLITPRQNRYDIQLGSTVLASPSFTEPEITDEMQEKLSMYGGSAHVVHSYDFVETSYVVRQEDTVTVRKNLPPSYTWSYERGALNAVPGLIEINQLMGDHLLIDRADVRLN